MHETLSDDKKMALLMRQNIHRRRFHKCSGEEKKRGGGRADSSIAGSEMRKLHSANCILKDT